MTRARIAVLASGTGTNLQAILEHFDRLGDRRAGDVVLVASDRPAAGALDRARRRGIAAEVIAPSETPSARAMEAVLEQYRVDLVVLAGFLRLIPMGTVARYAGRLVNVHPALLPSFGGMGMYGLRVHEAVLAAGVTISGVTAHFVDEAYDQGRIIAQWPVPVLVGDDARRLAARVLRVEHLLYPRVVDAVAAHRVTLASCRTSGGFTPEPSVAFTLLSREDDCLAEEIDRALGC